MTVPVPRNDWEDGELAANIPMAADLDIINDALEWLLGDTVPGFGGYSNLATALANNTWVAVPLNVEEEKRGGMVHSTVTNNSRITVPLTGWYKGAFTVAFDFSPSGGTAGRRSKDLRKNGSTFLNVRDDGLPMPAEIGGFSTVPAAFRVFLAANDYVELMAFQDSGNSNWKLWNLAYETYSAIEIWYDVEQS